MGTMVASDVYEGTREAKVEDLTGIRKTIKPLEESGALVRRIDEELLRALDSFVVVEREGQIIACATLFPFFKEKCGEVAAIAVSSDCLGQGQVHYYEDGSTPTGTCGVYVFGGEMSVYNQSLIRSSMSTIMKMSQHLLELAVC